VAGKVVYVDADPFCSLSGDIRKPMVALVSLSIVIALFLIWLIYFKGKVAGPGWVGAATKIFMVVL
jgi:hypothetical protein